MTTATKPTVSTRLLLLASLSADAQDAGIEVISADVQPYGMFLHCMGRPIVAFQRLRPHLTDLGPIEEYGPRGEDPRFKMSARYEGMPITIHVNGR